MNRVRPAPVTGALLPYPAVEIQQHSLRKVRVELRTYGGDDRNGKEYRRDVSPEGARLGLQDL